MIFRKSRTLFSSLGAALLILGVSSITGAEERSSVEKEDRRPGLTLGTSHYAESLYEEFSTSAGGAILFEVEPVIEAAAAEIAGRPFGEILRRPEKAITALSVGREFRSPRFVPPAADDLVEWPDMDATVDDLEELGYPVAKGTFRLLRVGTAIGASIATHQALELCWPEQGHCVVVDPAIQHLESILAHHRLLAAGAWSLRVQERKTALFRTKNASGGVCVLQSDPTWTSMTVGAPAYTVFVRDIVGAVVVTKDIALQEVTIDCVGNTPQTCRAQATAFSGQSGCVVTPGAPFNCADDNAGATGALAPAAKGVAETFVTHDQFPALSAANAMVVGQGGMNVRINWMLAGIPHGNDVTWSDSCIWKAP